MPDLDMSLIQLREEQVEAHAAFQRAAEAIKEADASTADLAELQTKFDEAEQRYTDAKAAYRAEEDRQVRARQKFELDQKAINAMKALEGAPSGGSSASMRVGREPLTYRKNGEHGFFNDLYRFSIHHDPGAAERLQRHAREMAFERAMKAGDLPSDAKFDLNSTDATGGQLVAPLYLQEQFITLARAGRVVADVLGPRDLPPNTDTINIPRMSTGTDVADQSDNAGIQETDAAFDSVSAAVKTKAGMQDVSQQLVDRSVPGIDQVIFADLAKAYAVKLDVDVINSSTSSNKGLLQVSGINSVTYTASTPTVAGLYPKLADSIQRIHTGIFMPPTAVFMHPRRWAFILASLDGQNRPLITPYAPQNAAGDQNGVVSQGAVGSVQGLPIYTDPNIPTNLGSGTNEDRIIVVRADECFLWEDPAGPYLETFRDVGSGNLTVRFRLHNYWAQVHERRPAAISVVSGTGLATPSF